MEYVAEQVAIGIKTEARLLTLANIRTAITPWWFLRLKRNSPGMDIRGVDARAMVRVENRTIEIPVEIKTSIMGKAHYYEKHPWAMEKGVVIIVANGRSDCQLVEHLYAMLEQARQRPGVYRGFFKWLVSQPLGPKAIAIKEGIKNRMALQPAE